MRRTLENRAPITPPGLALPTAVRDHVAAVDRSSGVLAQGFTVDELGLEWWTKALEQAAARTVGFRFEPGVDGTPRLTRRVICELAEETFAAEPSDEQIRMLMWHVLAWGSGTSRRQNGRRIASLSQRRAPEYIELLRSAATLARGAEPRAAYGSLIRRGGGVIPGYGPSFFTKYLYFAGEGADDHGCAILDARVASALHGLGWTALPAGYSNWYTATYESYCALLRRWSTELTQDIGRQVALDEIEYVLFRGSGYFASGGAGTPPSWIGQRVATPTDR